MLARRSPAHGLDAEHCDSPGPMTDYDARPETSEVPHSLAEAEEEAGRAQLRADEARARAMRLRQQADGAGNAESPSGKSRRRWVRRPGRKAVRIAAIVLVFASLAPSGYMVWQHLTLARERQRAVEFATAARNGVEMFMSIDPDH